MPPKKGKKHGKKRGPKKVGGIDKKRKKRGKKAVVEDLTDERTPMVEEKDETDGADEQTLMSEETDGSDGADEQTLMGEEKDGTHGDMEETGQGQNQTVLFQGVGGYSGWLEYKYDQSKGFYDGELSLNDGGTEVPVSFIPFQDIETARRVFHTTLRLVHERVLRPWCYFYCEDIGQHLVCYDRFDSFLTDAQPRYAKGHCELPIPWVQRQIQELGLAIVQMHMSSITHSALHEGSSYVLCGDEVKLVNLDGDLENVEEWRLMQDFKRFGQTVRQYFLDPRIKVWQRRDDFLKIFKFSKIRYNRLTKMVNGHPFLMKSDHLRLKYFSEIWHTYKSTTVSARVSQAFGQSGYLYFTYIHNRTHGWYRLDMSKEFQDMFDFGKQGVQQGNIQQGHTGADVDQLLKFLRNVYEHFYQHGITAEQAYAEIERCWFGLLDRVHEAVAE